MSHQNQEAIKWKVTRFCPAFFYENEHYKKNNAITDPHICLHIACFIDIVPAATEMGTPCFFSAGSWQHIQHKNPFPVKKQQPWAGLSTIASQVIPGAASLSGSRVPLFFFFHHDFVWKQKETTSCHQTSVQHNYYSYILPTTVNYVEITLPCTYTWLCKDHKYQASKECHTWMS